MKIHHVEQYTQAWWALKLGTPSASRFREILTKGGKPSASAEKYALSLAAEWATGLPASDYQSEWMERGVELEPEAVKFFEFQTGLKTHPGGFITDDAGTMGVSRDRLIYDDNDILVGDLEIKCPSQKVHMEYLLGSRSVMQDYKQQVQGGLLITGLPSSYTLSYHPTLPPALARVVRDEDYIDLLQAALYVFNARLEGYREQLATLGCTAKEPAVEVEF